LLCSPFGNLQGKQETIEQRKKESQKKEKVIEKEPNPHQFGRIVLQLENNILDLLNPLLLVHPESITVAHFSGHHSETLKAHQIISHHK